jgi:UDP-N-acetylglucosamine 4,6-dehydratase
MKKNKMILERTTLNSEKVKFYIGDVRDKESVSKVVKGVDYIFHAAALKTSPIM